MTRKLQPEGKKPPGRVAWYRKDAEIEKFLTDHYEEFEKCFKAKTVTPFYTSLTTKYFLQFVKEEAEVNPKSGVVTGSTQVGPAAQPSQTETVDLQDNQETRAVDFPQAQDQDSRTPSNGTDNAVAVNNTTIAATSSASTPTAESGDEDKGLDAASFQQVVKQLGWLSLPQGELLEKKKVFGEMRTKIGNYYRKEHRSLASNDILQRHPDFCVHVVRPRCVQRPSASRCVQGHVRPSASKC
ncbi:hypothetical protein K435DRAFT_915225, partial [Dendrothele bispora CBS 962.96]